MHFYREKKKKKKSLFHPMVKRDPKRRKHELQQTAMALHSRDTNWSQFSGVCRASLVSLMSYSYISCSPLNTLTAAPIVGFKSIH